MRISPAFAAPFVNVLYRVWCSTLRIREFGRDTVDALEAEGKPMMFALWHDEVFALMYTRRTLKIVAVVSQSRDGEYLARLLQALGIKTARGSSSRGGIAALLNASRLMREQSYNGCITVDGPKGPRHVVKPGAVILAFRTPAQVVPIRLFPAKAKVFRSWDRFQLPLPFSRVDIVFGEPYSVSAEKLTESELERERLALEERLHTLAVPVAGGSGSENGLQYRIFSTVAAFFKRLPWSFLRGAAGVMGGAFWLFARSRRKSAVEAITEHLQVSEQQAAVIARKSFSENFLSFLEIFHAGRFFTDQSVSVLYTPGVKALLQAETRPIVIATAHLGSWEMMPGLATDLLPDREGMVIVRRQRNPALNRLVAELRGARGMLVIDHRRAAQVVVPKLRKGGVAAFLVDHNTARKEAVFLPFLNDIAAVNMGPASLALRTKAAVFPVFLLRDGKGGHILHLLPPLHTDTLEGSLQERIKTIAAFYTKAVEEMVRQYPEQWFWMHKRWKTRPPEERKEDRA